MRPDALRQFFAIAASTLLLSTPLSAQAGLFRAYLSSTGNDANPCTLPQPCRLLPAALAAVNDGGDIWMLDSANYNTGPVMITKSVNILSVPGALGSVVGNGGVALHVGAAGVKVALRNLVIMNLSGGTYGIFMVNGEKLTVDKCEIFGFAEGGIRNIAAAKVSIVDTIVRDNNQGIELQNGTATISRSHVLGNQLWGISAFPQSGVTVTVFVSDTVSNNNNTGFLTYGYGPTGNFSRLYVTRSVASGNAHAGVYAQSDDARSDSLIELSHSLVSGNDNGLFNLGATIESAGDNRVSGNNTDVFGPITVTAGK